MWPSEAESRASELRGPTRYQISQAPERLPMAMLPWATQQSAESTSQEWKTVPQAAEVLPPESLLREEPKLGRVPWVPSELMAIREWLISQAQKAAWGLQQATFELPKLEPVPVEEQAI